MAAPLSAVSTLAAPKAEGLTVHQHSGWTTHDRDSATGEPRGGRTRPTGAAKSGPGAKQRHVTCPTGTNLAEAALVKLDHLGRTGKVSLGGPRVRGSLLTVVAR
jgi:hypothetical protein